MRSHWMLISLLLLSVLVPEAQGMRLRKDPSALDYGKQQKIYKKFFKGELEVVMELKKGFCAKGSTVQNDKNDDDKTHMKTEGSSPIEKIAKKDKNLSINLSAVTEQRQPDPETYPDTLDIAGMDYSQARRKPPIHN
ncbi:hypothetical protein Sango_1930500 [Sesamum angolense]|uniref:Uncharacterized protein n=1 Tax=Sesamum angolense TaxID=2727404 RepID=A0AAE1WE10_9LAMI|nr:hypothetical protein Sango_1930500 [Sesamum angolense]